MFSVAGEPLKGILNSGVLGKMEKAMLLLVQKSAAGAVDQERRDSYRANHSVSIELLDDHGEKVVEDSNAKVADVAEGIVSRKRVRVSSVASQGETSRRSVEVVGGSGINKTLTIVGNRGVMTPTIDEHGRKEIVRAEIRPSERWVGNATVPLHAFRIFNLPQDSVAYTGRTRAELAERCLGRAGRVKFFYFYVFVLFSSYLFPLVKFF